MASLLDRLIFDGLYGSRILSLLLCTLAITKWQMVLHMHEVMIINILCNFCMSTDYNRYDECKTKLTPFLKTVGFNPKTGW